MAGKCAQETGLIPRWEWRPSNRREPSRTGSADVIHYLASDCIPRGRH